jgi:glycerophosphoryl diester phosphodiesterase
LTERHGQPGGAARTKVPVEVDGPYGPVRLKWHKLRTHFHEAPFKPSNLALGWRTGASLEIDILTCADDSFVVLHDATLGPSTTGKGRVASIPIDAFAGHMHRDRNGDADPAAPILSLEDLLAIVATLPRAPTASLQLDLKMPEGRDMPASMIAAVSAAATGFEEAIIVGSTNLDAARSLVEALPGARLGYDPLRAVERSPDLAHAPERLLRHIEQRRQGVSIAYLHYQLVLEAAARGFPLVAELLALGIETDAWTINPDTGLTDQAMRDLLSSGIRQLTTDAPAELATRIAALR